MKARMGWLGVVAVGFGLVACGGDSGTPVVFDSGSGSTAAPPSSPTSNTGDPNAQVDPQNRSPQEGGNFLSDFDFVRSNITSGGVPKDAIPALTDPSFVGSLDPEAAYVRDDDLVLGVVINGEAKAYPHNIGWLHEITNDVVGGHPVVVSLCPLTGTGLVFDAEDPSDGSRIACGVSGFLFNNNLVMYDRRDNTSLYPQMLSVSISGPREGDDLSLLPVVETTWRYWKVLYPDAKVVGSAQLANSGNPGGYDGNTYQRYPYGAYRQPNTSPLFANTPPLSSNPTAQLFSNKDMMLGLRFGEIAKAYPFRSMASEDVVNDVVDGNSIVVVYYAQEKLAVPFFRDHGGTTLTFHKVASTQPAIFPFMIQDAETGTTWDLLGRGVAGPNAGQQLAQIPAHNAFWFAWATFWQNTGIL